VDAGLDKAAVRRIARAWSLPSADKPAAPCLASRIPHFQAVTPEKLQQIEQAETALLRLGFVDLRVRHHGDVARIELTPDDLLRAVRDPLRTAVRAAAMSAGFRFVAVDLAQHRLADRRLELGTLELGCSVDDERQVFCHALGVGLALAEGLAGDLLLNRLR